MTEENPRRKFLGISQKEKVLLEIQERDDWTIFKMTSRKWALKAGEKKAKDRDACKLIVKEAEVLHGPDSQ